MCPARSKKAGVETEGMQQAEIQLNRRLNRQNTNVISTKTAET